jgi:hypothetical protein
VRSVGGEKEIVSQNSTAIPTEVTDAAGFATNDLARSIRRCLWNQCGGMPNVCLHERLKWYEQTHAPWARARSEV